MVHQHLTCSPPSTFRASFTFPIDPAPICDEEPVSGCLIGAAKGWVAASLAMDVCLPFFPTQRFHSVQVWLSSTCQTCPAALTPVQKRSVQGRPHSTRSWPSYLDYGPIYDDGGHFARTLTAYAEDDLCLSFFQMFAPGRSQSHRCCWPPQELFGGLLLGERCAQERGEHRRPLSRYPLFALNGTSMVWIVDVGARLIVQQSWARLRLLPLGWRSVISSFPARAFNQPRIGFPLGLLA